MVQLKPVDKYNIWQIVELAVLKQQENFVATNTQSLLEACVTIVSGGVVLPFGIYDKDTPIGFVMFGFAPEEGDPKIAAGTYCIWRFTIDAPHQSKGLGKASLQTSLDYLKCGPCGPAPSSWLAYEPENTLARALYHCFGFQENGVMCSNEIGPVRPLSM